MGVIVIVGPWRGGAVGMGLRRQAPLHVLRLGLEPGS